MQNGENVDEEGEKKSFKDFNLARSYDITRILMVFARFSAVCCVLSLISTSLMMAWRLEVMGESDFNLSTQHSERRELMNDRGAPSIGLCEQDSKFQNQTSRSNVKHNKTSGRPAKTSKFHLFNLFLFIIHFPSAGVSTTGGGPEC